MHPQACIPYVLLQTRHEFQVWPGGQPWCTPAIHDAAARQAARRLPLPVELCLVKGGPVGGLGGVLQHLDHRRHAAHSRQQWRAMSCVYRTFSSDAPADKSHEAGGRIGYCGRRLRCPRCISTTVTRKPSPPFFPTTPSLQVYARRVATKGFRPPMEELLPKEFQFIIRQCWHADAKARPR